MGWEGQTTKKQEETLGGDGCVPYRDCGFVSIAGGTL